MDGRPLTRLRLAFVALGVALLLPLALLVRSASARLEEQRKLKHEVVAERIFDEMERELAALLERERARPSGAYDATNTRPETWARFVVGYFTCNAAGPQITARHLLRADRAERAATAARSAWRTWRPTEVDAAVSGARSQGEAPLLNPYRASGNASSASTTAAERSGAAQSSSRRDAPRRSPAPMAAAEPAPKQEAVLRKLNRSSQAKKSKEGRVDDLLKNAYDSKRATTGDDPLAGLDDL